MLQRVYKIDKLDPRVLPRAIDVEARTYKVDENWSAIEKLYDRWFADTNFMAKVHAADIVDKAAGTLKGSGRGYSAVLKYYDGVFANPKKYSIKDEKDMKSLIGKYGEIAWRTMDVERMKDAKRRADAVGLKLGGMFVSLYAPVLGLDEASRTATACSSKSRSCRMSFCLCPEKRSRVFAWRSNSPTAGSRRFISRRRRRIV